MAILGIETYGAARASLCEAKVRPVRGQIAVSCAFDSLRVIHEAIERERTDLLVRDDTVFAENKVREYEYIKDKDSSKTKKSKS